MTEGAERHFQLDSKQQEDNLLTMNIKNVGDEMQARKTDRRKGNQLLGKLGLLALLVLVAGCKMDLENEIWLKKNGSGRALLKAYVEYTSEDAEYADQELKEYDPLKLFERRILETRGAKLISKKTLDQSEEDLVAATFLLEFKFDQVSTLSRIMALDDYGCFYLSNEKKACKLNVYLENMAFIDRETISDAGADVADFETGYNLILHLPKAMQSASEDFELSADKKTVRFHFTLDDAWYDDPLVSLTVKY